MKKSKKIYKYIHWEQGETILKVMEDLEKLYNQGWGMISYNQGPYGMSVIIKRLNQPNQ